jgi:hypothetical protein
VVEWQVNHSPFNHLMQLLAQENFIKFSPHESITLYSSRDSLYSRDIKMAWESKNKNKKIPAQEDLHYSQWAQHKAWLTIKMFIIFTPIEVD